MAETGEVAVGLVHGDKRYQKRARRALPILVRQAKAHKKMYYSDLARELGMPNPRNLNYPLGAIGNSVLDLSHRWSRKVPPIQALVINKSTGLPGEGISWFAPDAHDFKKATRQERELIVDAMLQDVFTYQHWDDVLHALELPPAATAWPPGLETPNRPIGGEGLEHKALKEQIALHPEWVGVRRGATPGEIEAGLHSGDSVDVLFSTPSHQVAVEVKGRSASLAEIARGLFQCVKYEAVLVAQAQVSGLRVDCQALLALGAKLPSELVPLRHTLGITVRENVGEGN